MKAGDLINLLMTNGIDDEIENEIYEPITGKSVDTTAAIQIVKEGAFVPTLRIDVKAAKFKKKCKTIPPKCYQK